MDGDTEEPTQSNSVGRVGNAGFMVLLGAPGEGSWRALFGAGSLRHKKLGKHLERHRAGAARAEVRGGPYLLGLQCRVGVAGSLRVVAPGFEGHAGGGGHESLSDEEPVKA